MYLRLHILGVGGFVKGLGRILAVVCIALALGGGGCAFAQETKGSATGAEVFCGNPKKVLFGFKDAEHTQILVPEAYLYDPDGVFYGNNKPKDRMNFVSIEMNKSDGTPNCSNYVHNSWKFLSIYISLSSPDYFKVILDQYKISARNTNYVGIHNNKFYVYDNKKVFFTYNHGKLETYTYQQIRGLRITGFRNVSKGLRRLTV